MPKGKKICPSCSKEHGCRKLTCECGHEFKKGKQGRTTSPAKKELKKDWAKEVSPGKWVYHMDKGSSGVRIPDDLPIGPVTNDELYEYIIYNGLGDCIVDHVPARKIADPKLRKRWEKAHKAIREVWSYMNDDQPKRRKRRTTKGN